MLGEEGAIERLGACRGAEILQIGAGGLRVGGQRRARGHAAPKPAQIIRPRESGGGGPCEAWWRGRLIQRAAFVAGESSKLAPLPPRKCAIPLPRFRGAGKIAQPGLQRVTIIVTWALTCVSLSVTSRSESSSP